MKGIVHHDYGSSDVVRCEDVDKPTPGDDQVLVRIRAAALNPLDWHTMRGTPYPIRAGSGLRKPTNERLGFDLAGVVEAVGRNVTACRPGDEVFGAGRGALAEYLCVQEKSLAPKPTNLTFEEAAAIPVAALTALQGLRDKARIQKGQKVLINGAAGGVGTFAVQIAKSFGAEVTGVCSTRNVEMVRSLGADRVIDYTREDFTRNGQRHDLVFDNVGNHSLSACRRVLLPRGTCVVNGGPNGRWVGPLARGLRALVLSPFVSQSLVIFLAAMNRDDLLLLKELVEAGKVKPVIDRTYALRDSPEALRFLEEGHVRGKLVITVANA